MSYNASSNDKIYYTPIIHAKKPKYSEVKINMSDNYIKELFETSITMTGFISSNINDDKIISDILLNLGTIKDYYVGVPSSSGISKITVFFSEIYELKQKKTKTENIKNEYEEEYVYDEVKECMQVIEHSIENSGRDNEESDDEEYDNEFHYEDGYFWFDNGLHQVELYFY